MGAEASAPRLRAWSAARWILVALVTGIQGAFGWYFTMFGVSGMEDYDAALMISMFALPATLLLIVLDFRTTRQRGVLRSWIVLRAIAVPLVGLGIGSLVRVRFMTAGQPEAHVSFYDPAGVYAWQLTGLGAALLAVQPLVAGARRLAVAVFGAPQRTAEPGEPAVSSAAKWPGSPLAKRIAGSIAFALVAGALLVGVGRLYWHVAVSTWTSVPPMVATGTADGREIAVVPYDANALFRIEAHLRVAAYDLATGELVWDRRLPNEHGNPVSVDAILVDERGAFLRMDDSSHPAAWFVLDPRTGKITTTAEEGNLLVIDDMEEAARGIPGDVVEHFVARDDLIIDEGYDYVFTEDADIEPVFRYDDKSLVINPVTGRPAGQEHGFTLHGVCCAPSGLEARDEKGRVLWSIDGAVPEPRQVVAETASGRVVMLLEGPESKGRLVVASRTAVTESVIGDRGWFAW